MARDDLMRAYPEVSTPRECIVRQLNAAVSASGGEDRLRLTPGEEAAQSTQRSWSQSLVELGQ